MGADPFALLIPAAFGAPVPVSAIVFVRRCGVARGFVVQIWFLRSVVVALWFTRWLLVLTLSLLLEGVGNYIECLTGDVSLLG